MCWWFGKEHPVFQTPLTFHIVLSTLWPRCCYHSASVVEQITHWRVCCVVSDWVVLAGTRCRTLVVVFGRQYCDGMCCTVWSVWCPANSNCQCPAHHQHNNHVTTITVSCPDTCVHWCGDCNNVGVPLFYVCWLWIELCVWLLHQGVSSVCTISQLCQCCAWLMCCWNGCMPIYDQHMLIAHMLHQCQVCRLMSQIHMRWQYS